MMMMMLMMMTMVVLVVTVDDMTVMLNISKITVPMLIFVPAGDDEDDDDHDVDDYHADGEVGSCVVM
eukprot:8677314-Karenia_brevis.AAC.1